MRWNVHCHATRPSRRKYSNNKHNKSILRSASTRPWPTQSLSLSNVTLLAFCEKSTSLKCAPYSLLSFFFTVVPNASSSGGTCWPASRSTLISSPARALSVWPLKNVCAVPAQEQA